MPFREIFKLPVRSAAMMLAAALLAAFSAFAQEAAPARSGVVLKLDGPVTPANAQYLAREIEAASASGKELVLIEIDTPGGLVDSMKTIIKAMLASDTPVVTYVAPQGARSASAGLYIMYAASVSAMAPNTNTGAATPVEIGGGPTEEKPAQDDAAPADAPASDAPPAEEPAETVPALANDDALRAKVINDSVAYIRALAEEHGRNADWAEKAVREAASVTSREALELGVIDLIAENRADLIKQLDGRTVKTPKGERTLATANLSLEEIEPTLIERILGFIANPNVAVILMSLATTGIIIEMWNPGSIFPGLLGVLCLVLGLYAFQVLPFNWLGAMLMGIGALLIVVEAYAPTFGLAGLTGLGVFAAGLYLVFPEGFRVSTSLIATIVASAGAILALIFFAIVGSRSQGPMIGAEAIRRREGVVDDWDGKEGWVIIEGERWRARADRPLNPGDKVKVIEIDGLVLVVKQAKAGFFPSPAPQEA
ncbi:MAG: nodulation protein NfeD [Parvularculaceae bacterium]|nr:nodulation protein NfeD [Parvularculaceae bacterium]